MTSPHYLDRASGPPLAYHRLPGREPGVIFLGGFMSDMSGTKATELERRCRAEGRAFLRFDYRGHGDSGGTFDEGTIGRWADDAIDVLGRLTVGPQILVGSSMGAWIMLLAALARPERISALVGVAAAPDFTEEVLIPGLDAAERGLLESEGRVSRASAYGPDPYCITRELLQDARQHLVLRQPIALAQPFRLIHGLRDPDVPWQLSLRLSDRLASSDGRITLVKNGDHRLSREQDLDLIWREIHAFARD